MLQRFVLLTLGLSVILLTGYGATAKFIYPVDGRKLIRFNDGPAY